MTTPAAVADRALLRWFLRAVVVAGLAVDAYVHWDLAPRFDTLKGSGSPQISQGQLFRVDAALALVALVLVLVVRRRWAMAVAFLVAAGGLAVVLAYTYLGVGELGPLPDMHDPIWYADKTASAVGQAVAAAAALGYLVLPVRPRGTRGAPAESATRVPS